MSKQRRTFFFVALGLAVWAMMATLAAAYYYSEFVETRRTFDELKSLVIDVNVLLDYGNETLRWHSETVIAGATSFDALLAVTTNVEYETYTFGVYVTSIDGVQTEGGAHSGRGWFWYYWDAATSRWVNLEKAADAFILKPDDSIAWRYESYSFPL